MSNKNYILTRDGRIVPLSDDELMHFKYIKREKKNGKWVYYYDDPKANAKIKEADANMTANKKALYKADAYYKTAVLASKKTKARLKEKRDAAVDAYNNSIVNYLKAESAVKKRLGYQLASFLNSAANVQYKAQKAIANLFKKKKKKKTNTIPYAQQKMY